MYLGKKTCDVYIKRKDRHRMQRSKMNKEIFFKHEMQQRFRWTLITE